MGWLDTGADTGRYGRGSKEGEEARPRIRGGTREEKEEIWYLHEKFHLHPAALETRSSTIDRISSFEGFKTHTLSCLRRITKGDKEASARILDKDVHEGA